MKNNLDLRLTKERRVQAGFAALGNRQVSGQEGLGRETLSAWRHIASVPFIYFMIAPSVLLNISLFIYQAVCFRVYRIEAVKRSDHFFNRQDATQQSKQYR